MRKSPHYHSGPPRESTVPTQLDSGFASCRQRRLIADLVGTKTQRNHSLTASLVSFRRQFLVCRNLFPNQKSPHVLARPKAFTMWTGESMERKAGVTLLGTRNCFPAIVERINRRIHSRYSQRSRNGGSGIEQFSIVFGRCVTDSA